MNLGFLGHALQLVQQHSGSSDRQLCGIPLIGPKVVHNLPVAGPHKPDGFWCANASPPGIPRWTKPVVLWGPCGPRTLPTVRCAIDCFA